MSNENNSLLSIRNVVKRYGEKIAVDHISIEVPKGKIYGLLGPNGAGKTSLIRIITSITNADEGEVYFEGELINSRTPEKIGYMPEERGLYKKMKVGEQLLYLSNLKGLGDKEAKKRIKYWLDRFDIQDWYNKKVSELSKGMQQKIQFISTVMHNPPLLILDEPFSGLDPINTDLIKQEIKRLRDEGTTILFSTHRMEQVEEMCEEIALINNAKIGLTGLVSEIRTKFKENIYRIVGKESFEPIEIEGIHVLEHENNRLLFQAEKDELAQKTLLQYIQGGVAIQSFEEILPTIQEIFINVVQNSITHE